MSYCKQNELNLIQRALDGDSAAFDQLLAPYRRRLFKHILAIVKDPSDAEDVLQDTSLRIYRGLRNFRGEASFYTWIFRIGYNCAIEFSTQRRRLDEHGPCYHAQDGYADWEPVQCDDPESLVSGRQMAATLSAALDAMCPEYREALIMRGFDGLSYDEIADAMRCPIGTVKSRISSARLSITVQLRRHGFFCATGQA